jgi:hypothetical protein
MVVAPAVVYEALRTPNREIRRKLAKALTLGAWQRLPTEAFGECAELLEEIRQLRPGWCLAEPDLGAYWRQRADRDGSHGFWWRARTDPDAVAGHISSVEQDQMDRAREEAQELRATFGRSERFETIDLGRIRVFPEHAVSGWRGDLIEAWRVDSLGYYSATLVGPQRRNAAHASWDWLSPWLDVDQIRADDLSWHVLFLYDLRSDNMRRNWLRWAFRLVQASRRTTSGTPGDNQLGSYLTEVDVLVTADRAFAEVVQNVASQAWFGLACPLTVPGDRTRPPTEILKIAASSSC